MSRKESELLLTSMRRSGSGTRLLERGWTFMIIPPEEAGSEDLEEDSVISQAEVTEVVKHRWMRFSC